MLALASHVFLILTAFPREAFQNDGAALYPALIFVVLQARLALYLIYRVRSARLAAAFLSVFTLTYAAFAGFISLMVIGGTWL